MASGAPASIDRRPNSSVGSPTRHTSAPVEKSYPVRSAAGPKASSTSWDWCPDRSGRRPTGRPSTRSRRGLDRRRYTCLGRTGSCRRPLKAGTERQRFIFRCGAARGSRWILGITAANRARALTWSTTPPEAASAQDRRPPPPSRRPPVIAPLGAYLYLVFAVSGSDLAAEDGVAGDGVEQHERENEKPRSPEHERQTGMRRRGFGYGNAVRDHVWPE